MGTLWVVLSAVVLAQPAASRLDPAVDRFESGKFPEALDLFARLVDDPELPASSRALARIYTAAAWLALGKPDFARAQLQLAMQTDPDTVPDPAKFAPRLVTMYGEERAKLKLPAPKKAEPPPPEPRAEVPAPAPTPEPTPVAPEPAPTPAVTEQAPSRRLSGWWVPGLVGLIAAAWGGYFLAVADSDYKLLTSAEPPPAYVDAVAARNNGPISFGIGIALAAVGVVGVVASIVLFAVDRPTTVAVVPLSSGGAAVSVQGSW